MKHLNKILVAVVAVLAATWERFTTRGLSAANTYDAAVETHEESVRRTNDVAVTARHLLWAQGAGANTVQLATASLPALGTIDNTETAADAGQTVLLLGKGSTKKMVASGAITVGTHTAVYQDAGGKVSATGSIYVGVPLTSAASDGDLIEVDDTAAAPTAGFVTGQGGTVTQITSSSTGVTLSKLCGQITTVALTTAAAAEEVFTVTNTLVDANDVIVLSTTYAGAGTPALAVKGVAAGSFAVVITNLHASAALDAAVTLNFAVIKSVVA